MERVRNTLYSVLEQHRGIVILVFCLPASLIFGALLKCYLFIIKVFNPKDHDTKVLDIQCKIKQWNELPKLTRKPMCTSRPNWLSLSTTFFRKDLCHKIDIPLHDILGFDESSQKVRVEPLVTIRDITEYLLPRGFVLAVHLEIAEATLGGLAMGTGMTTHSHKVGLFHETILSFDVLLSDGCLVHATADNEYSDLFRALPWSHGTLGFVVALELRVVPAKPFVHLNYIPVKGQDKYCQMISELAGANNADKTTPDFVEAIVYSTDEAVILAGWFSTHGKKLKVNPINRWYKPWFYKHVETFLKEGYSEELIPLEDYLLRHNRSIFWVMESMIPFGNNPYFRLIFGWLLPPKVAFLKFTTTPGIRMMTITKQVFQDIVLPLTTLQRQIDLCDELFDLYPLLVYPCRVYDRGHCSGQLPRPPSYAKCPGTNYALYNDLGIYGVPGYVKRKEYYNPIESMRRMEAFTRKVGGFSFLYVDIFMTREEFANMFDLQLYEKVRKKYSADEGFPHLYDKVKPEFDLLRLVNSNKDE